MSVKTQKTVKVMKDAIKYADAKKPHPYDASATVVRVEGNIAWVHFDGGAEETPVRKTINAKAGDTVQVRVGGGDAWIVGNATAPPTDDRVANIASELAINANETANVANKKVEIAINLSELAEELATRAQASADGKNTIYYGSTTPTTGQSGDTWFNGAEDNAIYIHNGTTWVKEELGEDAIANLSITNAKIVNGTIQSAKIANLDAGKITSGTIDTNRLDVSGIISVGGLATDAEVAVAKNEAIADGRKYADNYLTVISGTTGISVHNQNNVSDYVNITSNAVHIASNGTKVASFTPTMVTLGISGQNRVQVQNDSNYQGLEIFDNSNNSIAWFGGGGIRVGKSGADRFLVNTSSLQAYDSSNNKYFEVSSSGITYGNNTVASQSYTDGKASTAQSNAQTYADGKASTAESNAKTYADGVASTAETNAKKVATNYLSFTSAGGVNVGYTVSGSALSSKVNIKGDGIRIYDGQGYVSGFFGNASSNNKTIVRIGRLDEDGHIYMEPSLFGIYNATETVSYVRITPTFARIGATTVDGNVTIDTTNGFSIYDAGQTKSYVRIKNDSNTNTAVARIGAVANNESRTEIRSSGIDFISRNSSGTDVNLAHLGYASGTAQSGTAVAPYYTFGERTSGNIGNYSVAEGANNIASGFTSHAEGFWSTASGHYSHAEGGSTASGEYSHAGGHLSVASGYASQALGNVCVANGDGQCVVGRYNEPDTTSVFIVGCGTSSLSKNALTVSSSGSLSVSGNMILPTGTSIGTYKDASKTQWMALIYGGSDGKITIGNGETTSVTVSAPVNALYRITSTTVATGSVAANSAKSSANYDITSYSTYINQGYEPVAISGEATDNSAIKATARIYDDSGTKKIRALFRNNSSSAVSTNYYFYILWLKATSA